MSDEQEEVLTAHLWRVSRAQAPLLEATQLTSSRHQRVSGVRGAQAGHPSRLQAVLVLRTTGWPAGWTLNDAPDYMCGGRRESAPVQAQLSRAGPYLGHQGGTEPRAGAREVD